MQLIQSSARPLEARLDWHHLAVLQGHSPVYGSLCVAGEAASPFSDSLVKRLVASTSEERLRESSAATPFLSISSLLMRVYGVPVLGVGEQAENQLLMPKNEPFSYAGMYGSDCRHDRQVVRRTSAVRILGVDE